MKHQRIGRILRGLSRVLRHSASERLWLRRLAAECGEMDGAQWQRDAAKVIRGIADQCDEKADLVYPLDKPPSRKVRQ